MGRIRLRTYLRLRRETLSAAKIGSHKRKSAAYPVDYTIKRLLRPKSALAREELHTKEAVGISTNADKSRTKQHAPVQ
jgi:hypothetical protein